MAARIIVVGGGGHARVLIDAMKLAGTSILGVVDPSLAADAPGPFGLPVLGGDEAIDRYSPENVMLVNAKGSTSSMAARNAIYRHFKAKGFRFATVIHPSAVISASATLSEGAQVMAGCVVQYGAVVGPDCIINTRASIDHDCRIGETVHIAPGATISGAVSVGDCTHVGAGATVIQGITIGRNSLIAAGVVVYRDVGDEVMMLKTS